MVININALSSRDIERLISKLEKINDNLVDKTNHKVYNICKELAKETEINYLNISESELDGNRNDDIMVTANENYGVSVNIEATGSDLGYIEFGTGTYSGNEKHPSSEWLRTVGWEYGVGSRIRHDSFRDVDYWWYNSAIKWGGNNNYTRSIGMKSFPYMYYCSQELRNRLRDKSRYKGVIKEILEGNL